MKVNDYNNAINTTYSNKTTHTSKIETTNAEKTIDKTSNKVEKDTAVIYEKSTETQDKQKTLPNKAIIAQMKADTNQRTNQLYSLVQKMFKKQGITYNNSTEMFDILRNGKFTADPDTIEQAKKDISEDGYWGVKQTSDRLVSFAQALSGNNPEQAEKMIAAVKKGFEQATKTWGGKLPDICQQTLDTTIEKLEKWRDGITTSVETTENV